MSATLLYVIFFQFYFLFCPLNSQMKLIPSVLSELATVTGFKLSCHYTNKRTVKTEITCHALGTPALCSGDFELV